MEIINGDCFDVMKTMEDNSFDVGFTSPPYNRKRNDKYKNFNDQIDDYKQFCVDFTEQLLRICKKYVFVNLQPNYYNRSDVYGYIGHYSNEIKNIFIWNKKNPFPSNGFNITNGYEIVVCFAKEPLKSNNTYTLNVITSNVNTSDTTYMHKAVMHIKVAEFFIENFTRPGMKVIDPFLGWGQLVSLVRSMEFVVLG